MNPEEGLCDIAPCRAKGNKQGCQNITIYTQIFLSKFSSSASLLQPQVNTHSKVLSLINSHMLTKLSLIVHNITAQMEQDLPVLFVCSHEINLCISIQRLPIFHMLVDLLVFVISLFQIGAEDPKCFSSFQTQKGDANPFRGNTYRSFLFRLGYESWWP